MAKLKIKTNFDFKKFNRVNKKAFMKALKKGAIQMLDWSANGSSKVQAKPPIRWGVLRASGSAFVGNKLVGTTMGTNPPSQGSPTPNKTFNDKKRTISIGYNTAYANRQHEDKMQPGIFSQQAGNSNPGNQWLQKHLIGDGSLLMKMISEILEKEL